MLYKQVVKERCCFIWLREMGLANRRFWHGNGLLLLQDT